MSMFRLVLAGRDHVQTFYVKRSYPQEFLVANRDLLYSRTGGATEIERCVRVAPSFCLQMVTWALLVSCG